MNTKTEAKPTFTEAVTPYAMAKVVSTITGKTLPPQMFYNYARKGYITATKVEGGKLIISAEDANTWLAKYLTPKAPKA
jgi:predicted site-specific integrase-resolvase